MPGVTVEEARLFTDPARAEVDMVFQFEHVSARPGADVEVGPPPAAAAATSRSSFGRWQDGLADVGWNSPLLEQPRPAARGLALRRRRRAPRGRGEDARHRPAPAPRDAVRLPGRGARDDERAVRHDRGLPRHRVFEPLRARRSRTARHPTTCCWRCARWAATTRARRCSGTPARTRASRPASRGSPVNPNHVEINAEAERADPDSVFHHYRRLIELRHSLPVDRRRRLHDAARRTTSASTRSRARSTASSCSCSATSPATR